MEDNKPTFGAKLKHAWNAFLNRDPTEQNTPEVISAQYGSFQRPDRRPMPRANEQSIVTSVYNRIAMDAAAIQIKHVRLDDNGRFIDTIDSGLNNCLNLEANIDQTGRSFIQDVAMSMMDEGCVAIVPTDTTINPNLSGSYDIEKIRTGKIIEWFPTQIKVNVYNEKTGRREDIFVNKASACIIENPLYNIMNEPNSTMQRLIRKLRLLDIVDEQSSAGKLDLIIQLPYTIKTEARRQQANQRREDIEQQLAGSKYGIAYTDGTEKVTQLNRPIENNLMKQVEYLTTMLYSQLGITQAVLDGTADEKTMLNYYNRTIEPIVSAITDEMKRKFLTKTARTQKQSILFFRDPFRLVPVNDLSEMADKFTRNEIMSTNEIRQIIGMKPSDDPDADALRNKNISQTPMSGPEDEGLESLDTDEMTPEEADEALRELDEYDSQLDDLENELYDGEVKHYASPYYDPVKAHEYYERTKHLRGIKSTRGMNQEGKNAAQYVKERLNAEKKQKITESKNTRDSTIKSLRDNRKSTIDRHRSEMKSKIESLRQQLKGMPKEQKAQMRENISSQIQSIREQNRQVRESLNAEFKTRSGEAKDSHRENASRIREEYEQKYISELEKMRNDKSFKKAAKAKKAPKKSGKKASAKKASSKQGKITWVAKKKNVKY